MNKGIVKMRANRIVCVLLSLAACSAGALAKEEQTVYYALFMDGQKVGHAELIRKVDGEKVAHTQSMQLTLQRGGVSMTVKAKAVTIETLTGKPVSFESSQTLGAMAMVARGKVTSEGMIEATTVAMGQQSTRTMDWPKEALMPEGIRLLSKPPGSSHTRTESSKKK